jgi:WD40 repeat protein
MDSAGTVELVDRNGKSWTVAGPFAAGVEGLAWSPRGDEVWFTAVTSGRHFGYSLIATDLRGRQRLVLTQPNMVRLHDISPDGRALISSERFQLSLFFYGLPDAAPRPLRWFDTSLVSDVSADGRALLFIETPAVGDSPYWYYFRDTDGSPPVKIHEGGVGWMRFSPDGKRIVISQLDPPAIYVYPVEAGEPVVIELPGLTVESAQLLPDGKSLLFEGHETSKPSRIWLTNLSGAKPRPVTREGLTGEVTPDGRYVLQDENLYPLDGGAPVPARGMTAQDGFAGWGDGASLFVWQPSELPLRVFKVDPTTGRRQLVKEFLPPDLTGYQRGSGVLRVSADGKRFAFSPWYRLAELYLVEGLK